MRSLIGDVKPRLRNPLAATARRIAQMHLTSTILPALASTLADGHGMTEELVDLGVALAFALRPPKPLQSEIPIGLLKGRGSKRKFRLN